MTARPPLAGVRVLDFSTLLPGPMAGLILADAGAEVIKVERPGKGEEMRSYVPRFGDTSANYAILNRGKRCIAIDLKAADAIEKLRPLIESADIVIEQFRPGVMDRLGLGYETMKAINPAIVYCAITGYGQNGPLRDEAGHDQNYLANAGLLMLGGDDAGKPVIPPGLIADIGGGSLPAVINILLALRQAEATGEGAYLDIAMTDGLLAWNWWAQAMLSTTGKVARPGGELLSGGSPRYRIYETADGRYVSAGPIEQKFWENFCAIIGLSKEMWDDSRDPASVIQAVAACIKAKDAAHWRQAFAGQDVCATIALTLDEAMEHPQFRERGLFARTVTDGTAEMPALPTPLAPVFRNADPQAASAPALGEGNDEFLKQTQSGEPAE